MARYQSIFEYCHKIYDFAEKNLVKLKGVKSLLFGGKSYNFWISPKKSREDEGSQIFVTYLAGNQSVFGFDFTEKNLVKLYGVESNLLRKSKRIFEHLGISENDRIHAPLMPFSSVDDVFVIPKDLPKYFYCDRVS